MAERELVGRTLDGDLEAFNQLYRKHRPRIYAAVLALTRDLDEAEDLVQVAFMRAFQGLAGFRGEAAFSTWLMQIAINVCTTHYRSKRTRQSWMDTIGTPDSQLRDAWEPARYEDPEEALDRKERREFVRRCIHSLPGPYREIMVLRYVEDRSYPEITEELQIPVGTVKTWLHRGRQQLKSEFQQLDPSVVEAL